MVKNRIHHEIFAIDKNTTTYTDCSLTDTDFHTMYKLDTPKILYAKSLADN